MTELNLDSKTRRQIQLEFRQEQETKFLESQPTQNTGLWQKRPRLFDVSDYQPHVNWKAIFDQDPDCAGAIIKIFEPFDNASCGSLECNYWFEETAPQHMTDVYNYTNASGDHKIVSVYVYGNPSRSAALDLTWYKTLDDGTPQERLSKWMRDDAHIYGLIRALKIGFRKNPTDDMTKLKNMANAFFDEVNLDWERPWKQYLPRPALTAQSNILAPNVIGEVIRRTYSRYSQLIEWGILPQKTKLGEYSATWFINQYLTDTFGNQFVFDNHKTWVARYKNFSKTGVMSVKQMVDLYAEIPDDFDILPFGIPNKLQVTGDALKIPEMCSDLGPTGLDGNIYIGTWKEMETYYGRTILRGAGAVVPDPIPEPIPDPIPIPETQPTTAKLIRPANARKVPNTIPANTPIAFLPTGTDLTILDTVVNSEGTWRKVVKTKDIFFIADKVGATKYLDTPKP
jgi:hypothetical protein